MNELADHNNDTSNDTNVTEPTEAPIEAPTLAPRPTSEVITPPSSYCSDVNLGEEACTERLRRHVLAFAQKALEKIIADGSWEAGILSIDSHITV